MRLANLNPFSRQADCQRAIARIHDRAEQLRRRSTSQLREDFTQHCKRTREFSQSVRRTTRTENLVEVFAYATEAVRRITGKTFFDVQLQAGMSLARGKIAEIQTGEGKTLITALPAILHATRGTGVHVATTNEYLSNRDYRELRPVYRALGLTAAYVHADLDLNQKRTGYRSDIVYATGDELGFDFLRDSILARSLEQKRLGETFLQTALGLPLDAQSIQRRCAMAIVDEADSVMIDQANTPLILAAGRDGPKTDATLYQYAADVAESLVEGQDFQIDRANSKLVISECGAKSIRSAINQRRNGSMGRAWLTMVRNALQAAYVLKRDVDYVVDGDAVCLVDANTGRIHPQRRWQSGLHQAVEIREGLSPSDEQPTDARITRQRFLSNYQTLAGLTGTAVGSNRDFTMFYALSVDVIPPNRPCQRQLLPTRYFASQPQKHRYAARQAASRSALGQPVLIGTRTIVDSRILAEELTALGVQFHLLNGVQDQQESKIIADAGKAGQVTVATNMAGRGTDIRLDDKAIDAGGLHVIATEHHESTRIDRQLAGRSARQGEPGSVQFLAAPTDRLIADHAREIRKQLLRISSVDGITSKRLSEQIEKLQRRLERIGLEKRRQLVARDSWLLETQSTLARTG